MSFDPMGYPQFDDCREIADQFYGNIIGQKDAEIERLRGAGQAISEQLKIAVREKQELKAELQNSGQRIAELEGLITELADALAYSTRFIQDHCADGHPDSESLLQRAREATR
jgi:hypothetical protein